MRSLLGTAGLRHRRREDTIAGVEPEIRELCEEEDVA
jgi:hypothetical protein